MNPAALLAKPPPAMMEKLMQVRVVLSPDEIAAFMRTQLATLPAA